MSQYTDKAMELADRIGYQEYSRGFESDTGSQIQATIHANRAQEIKKELRQHIEAGPPDCRICLNKRRCELNGPERFITPCTNFSQYEHALDYTPLCKEPR